jgi:V/A-type H+-transporting ATPase subunit I
VGGLSSRKRLESLVIVTMQKVRILGSRTRVAAAIETLQDLGVVHLCRPDLASPLAAMSLTAAHARHVKHVEAALDDVEETMARLDCASLPRVMPARIAAEGLPSEVRLARRARRAAVALTGESRALEEERDRLGHLTRVLAVFADMGIAASTDTTRTFFLVLSQEADDAVGRLQQALSESVGDTFALYTEALTGGELAVALVVSVADSQQIEELLPEEGVREIDLPEAFAYEDLASSLRALRRRLAEIDADLEGFAARRRRLARWLLPGLLRARGSFEDWLGATEALTTAAATRRLFVIEGWLPESERAALERVLLERVGPTIVIEDVGRESWSARDVPVAISNPRIFRPFEVITRWLPLPRYGTMDPTPFVAVFFPMFFGLILGDLGYGAILAVLALLGRLRSVEGSLMRSVSEIAVCCAAFSITFGFLFGELFGDLGHRALGMHAVAFSREDAFVPFLALALALGFVHVVLGLILGAISGLRTNLRHSLGRGLAAVMVVLTAAMLLAAVNVLPVAFFTPTAVALLLSFPLLIVLEGVIGPIEFLSRLSNILSYARIMALGTASVMLAVAANSMVGALGGAIVGVVFATLFHLVNFGLGVFSPTIHALRLHFVEFFGTFYSPGGLVYQPFRHWRPNSASTP